MELPYSNFSYSKYIELIQDFGTHYVSSGKLGGNFKDIEVHSRYSTLNLHALAREALIVYLQEKFSLGSFNIPRFEFICDLSYV